MRGKSATSRERRSRSAYNSQDGKTKTAALVDHDLPRCPFLGSGDCARHWSAVAAVRAMSAIGSAPVDLTRQRVLHKLGIFCGFAAALWLAGAEAPTKLVTVAVSPVVI